MPLIREDIAQRIPHQGSMCLLDRVEEWDDTHLHCRATSHRDADNPLRQHGRLGAATAIEYAAQAMALHGALTAGREEAPRAGYLTSVRDIRLAVAALDGFADDLEIEVERLMGDDNNVMYRFSVAAGGQEIACGRAAVRLDAGQHLGGSQST